MIRGLLARPRLSRLSLTSFSFAKMIKKALAVLALTPAAVLADPAFTVTLDETNIDAAISNATSMGTSLAQKIGPAVLGIGAAFILVSVCFFCYRLVVKFLTGSKRG